MNGKVEIVAWPDNSWCLASEVEEYGWKPMEYSRVWVPEEFLYEDDLIDEIVYNVFKGGHKRDVDGAIMDLNLHKVLK